MKRGVIILLLLIPLMSAVCEEGQININTASAEELDELSGIGPVRAQAIIDNRPFDSLDNIVEIYGIGEATLQSIKDQGLACVEDDDDGTNNKDSKESSPTTNSISEELDEAESVAPTPIILTSNTQKNINTEENNKTLSKADYAKYGFVIFCILIGILFLIRKKKTQPTEFEDGE